MIQVGYDDSRLNLPNKLDTEAMLDDTMTLLLSRIRKRFLAEEAPDGTKWIESTSGARRRAKGGTGTLFDTGRLFHSIQAHTKGPNYRAISTDVPYARKHQEGLGGEVKRVFLGFSTEDESLVHKLIARRIEEGFN